MSTVHVQELPGITIAHKCPEVMELTKNCKSLLGKVTWESWQICTDCLGGGRMVMAKSLFKIV